MNNNIKEDYCTYKVSKLLSKKGFKLHNNGEPVNSWIYKEGRDTYYTNVEGGIGGSQKTYQEIPHHIAIKWVFVNFGIYIGIDCNYSGDKWKFSIQNTKNGDFLVSDDEGVSEYPFYDSPEEATEAALLYTLKKLI